MIGKTTAPWRAMAGMLCVAVLVLASGGLAGVARAQGDKMPVYMGVMKNELGDTLVKFVFSDIAQRGRFAPLQAFSIRPRNGNCNVAGTADLNLPEEYTSSPVYDSAADAQEIPFETLPQYLANLVGAEVVRKDYAATDEEALPFALCTRQVWKEIVGAQ